MSETTRTVLLVLLMAFIALSGGRLYLRRQRRESVPLVRMHHAAYLVVGMALSGHGLGLLQGDLLANLEPLVELALGWAGLLFGLQFNGRALRQFPGRWIWATLAQSVATMGVVLLIMGGAFTRLFGWSGLELQLALLLVVVFGAATSPAEAVVAASGASRVRRRFAMFANYAASIDPAVPVLVLGAAAGWYHVSGGGLVPALEWLLASVLIGLVMGTIFYSYARHRHSENELVMMIIAFAILSGGIASYLKLSGLTISMVMGMLIGNSLKDTGEKVFRALVVRESPILVVLLVLVGAMWEPMTVAELWPVAGCLVMFIGARVLAKVVSVAAIAPLVGEDMEGAGGRGGLALLGQGGMSVALLASYQLLFGGQGPAAVVSIVLAALVVFEAIAAHTARLALERRKGDNGGEDGQ